MTAELPNVRLVLSSRAEHVWLVREMLSGVAEAINLDLIDLNDMRTAVTEACNNVVLHAYPGEVGPLEVEVYLSSGTTAVVVRDHGTGLQPRYEAHSEPILGLGLLVIRELTCCMDIPENNGEGLTVRMDFAATGARRLEVPCEDGLELPRIAQSENLPTIDVTVAPSDLARTVLPRIFGVLATFANFSTDRISEVQLVTEELAAHAPRLIRGAYLNITASVEPRTLELWVGPLGPGRAQRLLLDPTLENLSTRIEKLTDQRRVTPAGYSEVLALRLVDSSR
jgi:serine/threonine-protein kinase RsbW